MPPSVRTALIPAHNKNRFIRDLLVRKANAKVQKPCPRGMPDAHVSRGRCKPLRENQIGKQCRLLSLEGGQGNFTDYLKFTDRPFGQTGVRWLTARCRRGE
jgi:hypothetical protein